MPIPIGCWRRRCHPACRVSSRIGANAAATARLALSAGLKVLFPIPVMMTTPPIDDVPEERDRSSTPGAPVRTAERVGHSSWGLASGVDGEFVIAGGLTAEFVAGAIAKSGAWGVLTSHRVSKRLPGSRTMI